MSSSVASMHELLSTPLGRRLGTAAAGGTVLALGVYFGQGYTSSRERERRLEQKCESLQARIDKLELSERDNLAEGAMALIMNAEAHAKTVIEKKEARRKLRTAKVEVAGSRAANQELVEEIHSLKVFQRCHMHANSFVQYVGACVAGLIYTYHREACINDTLISDLAWRHSLFYYSL
ncbi:hypothetical protein ABBQ38_008098 [Trebouxia sp. C0009 RCD-2024]